MNANRKYLGSLGLAIIIIVGGFGLTLLPSSHGSGYPVVDIFWDDGTPITHIAVAIYDNATGAFIGNCTETPIGEYACPNRADCYSFVRVDLIILGSTASYVRQVGPLRLSVTGEVKLADIIVNSSNFIIPLIPDVPTLGGPK